ncbi:hypothetical protein MTO96_002776 [Rhipicephalus appendiculatus]
MLAARFACIKKSGPSDTRRCLTGKPKAGRTEPVSVRPSESNGGRRIGAHLRRRSSNKASRVASLYQRPADNSGQRLRRVNTEPRRPLSAAPSYEGNSAGVSYTARSRSPRQKNGCALLEQLGAAGASCCRDARQGSSDCGSEGQGPNNTLTAAASTHDADRNDIARPRGEEGMCPRAFSECVAEDDDAKRSAWERQETKQRSRDVKNEKKVNPNKKPDSR